MDFEAKKYNEMMYNISTEENMKRRIRKIISGNRDKKYDIVLDIGCSGGQYTTLLDSEITVGHIYGVDISEDVIEFAKQNHMKENISYYAQDFAVEFDCLAPELKALEGQVSLIFSNGVFYLIQDLKNLSHNLYRMLSKGGEVCACVLRMPDPYIDLAPEAKAIHEREFMKMPDPQTRLDDMFSAFKAVGFDVTFVENHEFIKAVPLAKFRQSKLPITLSSYKPYFLVTDEAKVELMMKALADKLLANERQFTDESTGETMIDNRMALTTFRLIK